MALPVYRYQLPVPKQLLFLIILTTTTCTHPASASASASASAKPSPPLLLDRYTLRRAPTVAANATTAEYIDPTLPPIVLPNGAPNYSLLLLTHDFAYTYGSPPAAANFTIPNDLEWSRAVLEFSASCAGEQYDRIAAVWVDGVELLRTSTAEPTEAGVFWSVRKDVSRYAAGLRSPLSGEPRILTVMLENIVNDVYTGIYHVNVSLHFYNDGVKDGQTGGELGVFKGFGSAQLGLVSTVSNEKKARKLGSSPDKTILLPSEQSLAGRSSNFNFDPAYSRPADLILPISYENGEDDGFWFRIKGSGDIHSRSITIPQNTYRAKLEVYVSFHGDDEFWYSNPPNSYIRLNNLPTTRGNGSFRQVVATVDGRYVGSVVPYPVVFTGGINPLFWEPVVSVGAFDLPSYEFELTPFLGNLLDGQPHQLGLSVEDAISFWLVDANLHLWLDPEPAAVTAGLMSYRVPGVSMSRKSKGQGLDGKFKIKAEAEIEFSGWVNCSLGNVTYNIEQELDFKSTVEYKQAGNLKEVYTKSKSKTKVKLQLYRDGVRVAKAQYHHKLKFPIDVVMETIPGPSTSNYKLKTNLSHELYDDTQFTLNELPIYSRTVDDKQSGAGWMEVEDHSVLAGSTNTEQVYLYVGPEGCFSRNLTVKDNEIQKDEALPSCAFTI